MSSPVCLASFFSLPRPFSSSSIASASALSNIPLTSHRFSKHVPPHKTSRVSKYAPHSPTPLPPKNRSITKAFSYIAIFQGLPSYLSGGLFQSGHKFVFIAVRKWDFFHANSSTSMWLMLITDVRQSRRNSWGASVHSNTSKIHFWRLFWLNRRHTSQRKSSVSFFFCVLFVCLFVLQFPSHVYSSHTSLFVLPAFTNNSDELLQTVPWFEAGWYGVALFLFILDVVQSCHILPFYIRSDATSRSWLNGGD